MARSTEDILVAKESAVVRYKGDKIVIRAGVTRVRVGHPILKGREHLFEPLTVHYDVEQATQVPGEKRYGKTRESKPDDGSG